MKVVTPKYMKKIYPESINNKFTKTKKHYQSKSTRNFCQLVQKTFQLWNKLCFPRIKCQSVYIQSIKCKKKRFKLSEKEIVMCNSKI